MSDKIRRLIGIGIWLTVLGAGTLGADEWHGSVATESQMFPLSPRGDDQPYANLSLILRPEYVLEWADGDQRLAFEGFLRVDQNDTRRTHLDIRELYWERVSRMWELRVGIHTVFWGVTESQHLVDVVNQTDLVERPDGEAKLGQPMVNLSLVGAWGTVDLFGLVGCRKRTFPGQDGRFRPLLYIDGAQSLYGQGRFRRHLNWAVRWAQALGDFDVGVSHFSGTGREPILGPGVHRDGASVLVPRYAVLEQTGLDVQWTRGGWLWKLETVRRDGEGDAFYAFTGGFEYTFGNLRDSGTDLGVLVEYLYDDRDTRALTPFEDDVFVGARLALNDAQSTQVLAGVIVDRTQGARIFSVEGSRRVGDRWTVNLEARGFQGTGSGDPLHALRRDGYVQFEIARHF